MINPKESKAEEKVDCVISGKHKPEDFIVEEIEKTYLNCELNCQGEISGSGRICAICNNFRPTYYAKGIATGKRQERERILKLLKEIYDEGTHQDDEFNHGYDSSLQELEILINKEW